MLHFDSYINLTSKSYNSESFYIKKRDSNYFKNATRIYQKNFSFPFKEFKIILI